MAARACKTYTQYYSICMYWKYFIVCVQLTFRLCYSFRCQWHCGTSVCIFMKKKNPTGTECVSKACMYVFVIHLIFRFMYPMIAIEVAADFVYIETHNTRCVLLLMTLLLNLYTIYYSNRIIRQRYFNRLLCEIHSTNRYTFSLCNGLSVYFAKLMRCSFF